MSVLDIYAGPRALEKLKQNGFSQEQFDYMLGASGGPKWFVLAGLDRYIFSTFFKDRTTPLDIIGSSAGAFRFACFGQKDPLAAINRLADRYSHTTYSDKPTPKEITDKGWALLDYVLGEQGAEEIVNNPIIRAHFIVARCSGLDRFENKPMQMTGLMASASANLVKRKWLEKFYERYVFCSPASALHIDDPANMPSYFVDLSVENLKKALMASGSIPIVIEGVEDIPGAPKGMYRDGGIIDYHFDLSFSRKDETGGGLTLYPHFFTDPKPGWFDKSLKKRKPHASSYDDVVMLVPSESFVKALPYGKIPDRKDFENLDADTRIKYWETVLSETNRLGDEFSSLIDSGQIVSSIKPLPFV